MREVSNAEIRSPAYVLDLDLARAYVDDVVDVARFRSVWCLVRRSGVAIAKRFLDVEGDSHLQLREVADMLQGGVPPHVLMAPEAEAPVDSSSVTVVICTRDRREGLVVTLASLARQSDSDFKVLVVDNSSGGEVARTLSAYEGLVISCCHEPSPGLSRARNCGLARVDTDVVAWIDDDEVADGDWVKWLKAGFSCSADVSAVAGVMLPAELETQAQVDFERYGGFNKGRGMLPELLIAGTPSAPDPLYPLPNFGAGGNMAFRTDVLRAMGGFDPHLGAGTLTQGGEETRALAMLLESGGQIQYWPPAVTWHYHRRTTAALEKQFYGYSAGLTAFYMSVLMDSPGAATRIAGLLGPGFKQVLANWRRESKNGPPSDFPEFLLKAGRRGLAAGAWLYLREWARQRPIPRASVG